MKEFTENKILTIHFWVRDLPLSEVGEDLERNWGRGNHDQNILYKYLSVKINRPQLFI